MNAIAQFPAMEADAALLRASIRAVGRRARWCAPDYHGRAAREGAAHDAHARAAMQQEQAAGNVDDERREAPLEFGEPIDARTEEDGDDVPW